jgi:pimeloyl-ACP methyl ester carboxylesterase
MLEPLIRDLAEARTVWAFDTPGYGSSDPLEEQDPSAGDYADALADTIVAAGIPKPDLYGAHTGAKIALELANRRPDMIRRLVLDGLSLYTSEEREQHLANYTPAIDPEPDGSHLLRYWNMRRDMHVYFPWYLHTATARMDREIPGPEELHDHLVDFLKAGSGYGKGYRAAFTHNTSEALDLLTVPTLILASPRDPVRAHLKRVTDSAMITVASPNAAEHPVLAVSRRVVEFLGED